LIGLISLISSNSTRGEKMKPTGNTILITGGGSGIGLALAHEFKELGNEVIIAGRSKEKLARVEKEGFSTLVVDMLDAKNIASFAQEALRKFPALNVVIHNAGIMRAENLKAGPTTQTINETVATNFLGPLLLNENLLPHLLKQKSAAIMTVSSGLAFLPLASTPTYSATKAAIHSYSESLRYQLKGTSVQVIELAPPYVQTELMGAEQAQDPHAMPLKEFIAEVMGLLKSKPDIREVLVERVQPLRFASRKPTEDYEAFFTQFNDRMNKF
jgi:uncharacterized oxidoreductase